jgi:ATP-dependent RNA helicase DDX56/DBP9
VCVHLYLILPYSLTRSQSIDLQKLDTLVIDEADLILSYGHDFDIRAILSGGYLPKVFQSFLMSATMTEDVETLKGLTLRKPVRVFLRVKDMSLTFGRKAILRLEEDEDEAANLAQYSVRYVVPLSCRP